MRWTRLFAALVALLASGRSTTAQVTTGRIAGTVTDSANATAIASATITVVGTRLGGISGADGRFTIADVPAGAQRLRVTRLGFTPLDETVQVTAGQVSTIAVRLRSAATTLSQVVVVGYGSQRRSDVTGAVASVTPNVEQTPITSIEQTLQGTAPGVQVTAASSAPGGGISVRIRGASSINGNGEPLYVIDGFPIENDPTNQGNPSDAGRVNTAPTNPLASLNPSDIESIEVLKDASATSIYGARGANGVVMISTKRGLASSTKITLDAYGGSQSVAKRYDLLNATEYGQYANEWAAASNLAKPYADPTSLGGGTDWQDVIFRSAPVYNLQLGVTGGTTSRNATRYALSGGTFQQQGVVRGSDFDRLSLRGNLEQTVSRLRLSSNVLVSQISSNMVPGEGTIGSTGASAVTAALQYVPVLTPRKADGSYTFSNLDFPQEITALGVGVINIPNPLSQATEVQDKLGDTRLLANVFGEIELFTGLRFRSSLGGDYSNRTRDTYFPRTTLQGFGRNGYANRGQQQITSFLNENTLNYERQFRGMHEINAVAGYTRQTQNANRTGEINENFVSDITGYENLGAGSRVGGPGVSSSHAKWTLASYLARVNYTLLGRYLFTGTVRRDGSSRFGEDNQWGTFPSVALAWRLSEEPFMKRFSFIDQLKLRGSYGKAGNPSIQPYQSVTRLSSGQYSFGGTQVSGYYPNSIGNPKLTWESTMQKDIGLDLAVFSNRAEVTVDWYDKQTDDLLLGIDLPAEIGFTTALVNAGAIQNRGIELGLTLHVIEGNPRRGDLAWRTTLSYARNKNKVLDLGGPTRIFSSQCIAPDISANCPGTAVTVGEPIGRFYGYQTSGIFRDSAEVAEYLKTTRLASGTITPGQIRVVDVNKDGIINADDRTLLGDPNPDWTGGWQNIVSWKGFDLSSLIDGSYGSKIFNLNLYRLDGSGPGFNLNRERYRDAWRADNPDGTQPRLTSTPTSVGTDFTDRLLEDGSYLRLRTITISRTVPSRWTSGRLDNARIYVTGQNLYTWSDYSGFNPDVSSLGVGNLNRGIDIGSYPLARTVIFGVNVSY